MIERLYIIGAGGHGKVAADCADAMGCFGDIKFLDNAYPERQCLLDWDIVGKPDAVTDLSSGQNVRFFVAIGDCQTRARVTEGILEEGATLATLIHPTAVVSSRADVGVGTLICANATVNVATKIGQGCIINTAATIDHDCTIVQYTHIAPGVNLAGAVLIDQRTFVGIGSAVAQGVTIGECCVIGAGAAVVNDIPSNTLAVGVPARVKKSTM
jgi:sugar O-acyltransferase (sialic acid O-acetyltransferase NeuD family)